jgi:hypothetical protein
VASTTVAPCSMVAMRMSCPRQSMNKTCANELHSVTAPRSLAWQVVLCVRVMRAIVSRSRTNLGFAFVNLGADCEKGGTTYCSALYPEGGRVHRRGK